MFYSITLARIIGPSCLAIAIAMLLSPQVFRQAIEEFQGGGQKMLLLLAGASHVIFGLAIVTLHPVWHWDWPLVITVIGALLFLRGIFLLWFPNQIVTLAKSLRQLLWWPYLASGILFSTGLLLVIKAY